jgi:hypothetical protein
MLLRLDLSRRALPVFLGVLALACAGVLFAWDAFPEIFPAGSHEGLAALSLSAIAVAYLVYQVLRGAAGGELVKSVLLALAFLFWAANQLWPALRAATLFNDLAIALFVLDIFLVMAGWPPASADNSFPCGCAPFAGCGAEPREKERS